MAQASGTSRSSRQSETHAALARLSLLMQISWWKSNLAMATLNRKPYSNLPGGRSCVIRLPSILVLGEAAALCEWQAAKKHHDEHTWVSVRPESEQDPSYGLVSAGPGNPKTLNPRRLSKALPDSMMLRLRLPACSGRNTTAGRAEASNLGALTIKTGLGD